MDPSPEKFEPSAYLAAIVNSSDDAIVSKNLSGIIQSWNKAAEHMFGYSAREAIGQPVLLIIPPHLHDEEAYILSRVRDGHRIDHFETVRQRKDGTLLDVSLTVSPIRNANGTIIGASKIARDITEHKKALAASAEAQSRLVVTLQSIGDAVMAMDAQSIVTFVNPIAEKLLGYLQKDLIGRPMANVFHIVNEDTRRPVENPVERVLAEGNIVGLANHTLLLRPDGSEVPIADSAAPITNSEGKLLGVVLVFRDVTEEHRTTRMAALLSSIITSCEDAIISKDLSGTITSWNPGAERIFGYTSEEVVGHSIRLLIPPDRQDEEADILSRVNRGQRIEHYETFRRKKNGQLCEVALTISPLKDANGRIIGASKIARDVTEYNRAKRALHASQEQWRITLESISDAVIVTDTKASVTFANAAACDLLGRPKAAVIERPLAEVFHIVNADTRKPVNSPVDRVILEGVVVGLANHTVLTRPDGSELSIDDSAAPIRDEKGRLSGVVLVFRKIVKM